MTEWTQHIRAAAQALKPHVRETSVLRRYHVGASVGIELKFEHMQHMGNFKVRGAINTLLHGDIPPAGVVAASGGNHGAAVAFAAKNLGVAAHIFVPELAGPTKIDLIKSTGADLTVVAGQYVNALDAAMAYAKDTGAMQIHAYDAPQTVVGQGTLFAEWQEQGLEADTLLIAVGGGGLIAGALAWFGASKKIVAVEPETCATLNGALLAGAPVDVPVSGVAVNALGAKRIGSICFGLATQYNTPSVLVSDDDILRAQATLWQDLRQYVEPAGATALAALTSGAYIPALGEKVAVLVCGANPNDLPKITML